MGHRTLLQVEVDTEELGLYLAIAFQGRRREELEGLGLGEVVQRRRHPRAKKIQFTTAEVLSRKEGGGEESRFLERERQPTAEETKLMLSLAIQEAVCACMNHHVYSLGQDTLIQGRGGPIGLKLSGAAAKVFMVNWCRRFEAKLRTAMATIPSFDLHLMNFYVDDELEVVEELPLGSRLVEGVVRVVEEEVEGDRMVAGDRRTAEVVLEVANSVCPHTRLSVDFPSAHQSGWMPLLDLQVQVAEDRSIDWKFFRKPVSAPYFIMNRSANSAKEKRACLAQESLRRLRNTRPRLVERHKVELLEDMGEMMLRSGYPEEFRAGVLESALVGYQRQVEASQRGQTPLYRPRAWKEQERRMRKQMKKAAWYRPADTVLFLPATPGSELTRRVRTVVQEEGRRLGISIRCVERAGVSLKQQLVRTDLSAGNPCPQDDCMLCITNPEEGGGLLHHRSGALYTSSCTICPMNEFTAHPSNQIHM